MTVGQARQEGLQLKVNKHCWTACRPVEAIAQAEQKLEAVKVARKRQGDGGESILYIQHITFDCCCCLEVPSAVRSDILVTALALYVIVQHQLVPPLCT
jgi:hypothetical protein